MRNAAQYFWNELMYYLQTNTKNTADYNIAITFLKYMDHIPDAKIEEIAHHANVTPSTISKFCKKLGFDGYNELKESLKRLEVQETEVIAIRRNFKPEQYEDAFLIYDSRMTTLFFENMKKNDQVKKLCNAIIQSKSICVISPDYTSNAIISFARTCLEIGIDCLKLSRKTDIDLMLDLSKDYDLLITVSSTGKWIQKTPEFFDKIHGSFQNAFIIGSDTMVEHLTNYPDFSPVVIEDEALLLNSHYHSTRLYSLFFMYISLNI